MCRNGYLGENIKIRANHQIYLIILIQLNTGLRIGDVLSLKRKNLFNSFLDVQEQKTSKFQKRKINKEIFEIVEAYCNRKKIDLEDRLFTVGVRWVQKYLQKIGDILGVCSMSTHSFRKTYAHIQYINNDCNIELVRKLLNHSSVAVTQRYLGVTEKEVNEASSSFKIIF